MCHASVLWKIVHLLSIHELVVKQSSVSTIMLPKDDMLKKAEDKPASAI
jgi:hypothetical protein